MVVNLGADVAAAVPGFRAQAESLMVDVCLITRTVKVWDEETLSYDDTPTTIYEGPCRLKRGGTQAVQVEAAGQLLVSQDSVLSLPVATSGGVQEGDVATLTTCVLDPALVGTKYTVQAFGGGTFTTARRLPVKELS